MIAWYYATHIYQSYVCFRGHNLLSTGITVRYPSEERFILGYPGTVFDRSSKLIRNGSAFCERQLDFKERGYFVEYDIFISCTILQSRSNATAAEVSPYTVKLGKVYLGPPTLCRKYLPSGCDYDDVHDEGSPSTWTILPGYVVGNL